MGTNISEEPVTVIFKVEEDKGIRFFQNASTSLTSEVCGGQSGTGAGFLQVLQIPLPIILPISPSS
jgi:hypothetical protein